MAGFRTLLCVLVLGLGPSCRSAGPEAKSPAESPPPESVPESPPPQSPNRCQEIVICGHRFFAGTRVVLWSEPPGYRAGDSHFQAGRKERGDRGRVLVEPESGDVERLREVVDQFVLHYDAVGSSQGCFRILEEVGGLSVHFLLDVDGTLYQTLDLRDQAWHATKANPRSIGVEIANAGVRPDGSQPPFTREQYASLARLAAALCIVFPRIAPEAPRDGAGRVRTDALSEEAFESFHGILGHLHVQKEKQDPGPAFDWEGFLAGVRAILLVAP